MSADVKQQFRVHLVGKVSKDAEIETVKTKNGDRPLVKFSMWVTSGKNRKTQEWQTPFFFSVKIWGDRYKGIRKGDDIAVTGLMTRYEPEKGKFYDTVEVSTDEHGEPGVIWSGDSHTQVGKHVSDEAVSRGQGKTIQRKAEEKLPITDEDIPF
jgi:single-stranded DNA-binding protein